MLCTLHNMPNWGKSTADWILHAGEKNYDKIFYQKIFENRFLILLKVQRKWDRKLGILLHKNTQCTCWIFVSGFSLKKF